MQRVDCSDFASLRAAMTGGIVQGILDQPSKNNVRQWLGFVFASLTFALPLVWFVSKEATDWVVRIMLVFFLLSIGRKALPVYRDRMVQLCMLLALIVVIGYIWQRFSVPEALLGGSSAKKYVPAFCFFVVAAYGINAAPRMSPFLLLISAGVGLLVHLSSIPADVWLAGWQGKRQAFGFWNEQHTSVILSTGLLAGALFLLRMFGSKRAWLPLLLLVGFTLLMLFGVTVTQTRAAWLGLILSAVILLLFCAVALLIGRRSMRWRELIRVAATGASVLLVGSAVFYFGTDTITQRFSGETVNTATIVEAAELKTTPRTSSGIRIGTWSAALEWIAERPVFGWGGDGGGKLIEQSPYFDEHFTPRHMHNSYIETLIGVGGAAFVCMVAIAFLVAWRTAVAWHQGRIPADVFLFSCAFFSFWVVVNIFESYIMYTSGVFLNALIGGFVYSWYLRSQHDSPQPLKKNFNSSVYCMRDCSTSSHSEAVSYNKTAITSQANLPKISILVPVFNTEQYLRQCLESILNQSYKNIEVICVNDCSTDNSLTILTEYAKKDRRIFIIDKQVNEGSSQARRTALINSTGEYILPVDSDDWLEQNMVEELYYCLTTGGYNMVCCGYFEENDNGTHFDPPQILPENKMEQIKYGIFGFGNTKVLWNKLVKREIYEKVKFSKESNGEDCYITCQNLYYSNKVGYLPSPLYHQRQSGGSLTTNKSIAQQRYEDRKANYNHIIEFCIEKFGHDLSFFEPELRKRMAYIEKQNPAVKRKFFSFFR